MLTDTSSSAHALMSPMGSVRITDGPFSRLQRRCAEITAPAIGAQLFDPAVGHAIENFRIAAGDADGTHQGPPFMDGDLYKWLEAAAVLTATGAADFTAELDEAADLIARAQRPDGYVHTQTLIAHRAAGVDQPLADRLNFETYNLGHLMTLGCVHHRLTGSDTYLDLGRRAAAYLLGLLDDHPDLLGRSAICPSHYMGAVELYRTTRDPDHLRLAIGLLDVRDRVTTGGDDNQDRIPVREHRRIVGHAVRANYLYAGVTDVVLETGDQGLRDVVTAVWDDLVGSKLAITGGCGALFDGASPDGCPDQTQITRVHQAYGRAFQLPNTTGHHESCSAIGLVLWAWRMLLLTGESRYADTIEQVLVNVLPATIGLDGRSYFYTNPLRQVRDLPYPLRRPGDTALEPVPDPPASDSRLRQEWMSCFCCPPNIARTLAELAYLVYATGDDGLWVHQYADSELTWTLGGHEVLVTQSCGLPLSGRVILRFSADAPAAGVIRVRIPDWDPSATVTCDGVEVVDRDRGYAVIQTTITPDTVIELRASPRVRLVAANRFAEELTGQVAVVRGPVVYCVESADLPADVGIEQVLVGRDTAWTPEVVAGLDGALALRGTLFLAPAAASDSLYREVEPEPPRPCELMLVPYAVWGNRGPGEMSVWLGRSW